MPLIDQPPFADELQAALAARGGEAVSVPMIQPAEPFLDTAGEDLRRRIFMTESETGASLCLRPEFTIPVCRRHIEAAAGTPRRYAYGGPVFRQRREGPREFFQAGIEDLGDPERAKADARVIGDAVAVLETLLGDGLSTTIGDQAVFEAVVAALGLPRGWQKRLVHAFGNPVALAAMLESLADPQPADDLADARAAELVASGEEAALARHVGARMEETGYSPHAGRTPEAIAHRLMEKTELARTRLEPSALAVLQEFLSFDVPLAGAPSELARFAERTGLAIGEALKDFSARVAALGHAPIAAMHYRAAFGRPLDYYTGLVFEVTDEDGAVLAGGGRYDRLMTMLGAAEPIPAVGFALWLDRIERARAKR
ncbi:ATP phosphoribosyltransferase regulatory subunit [Pararhizobium mangrovi]|uniref:ATP phosphoribosyltransferase regulatory subunit n=1 Tax=Pararhizobium mangrovi TaxID=2590452 RepID=A0A506TWY5_9HYPH|nr:ATP phosphoribosyltransferase regulatory subunit [Pararhizobium mangrovi]TPW26583.1 ATP phosphoribosyltransferase regulatory subunit [Pararhizobium mangrovi]